MRRWSKKKMRTKNSLKEKEKFVNLFCGLSDYEKAAISRGLGISLIEITPEKILDNFSKLSKRSRKKLIMLMEAHINDKTKAAQPEQAE